MGLLNTLLINLKVRNSGLHAGLKQSESALVSFKNSVVRNVAGPLAAAFGIRQLARFTAAALEAADRVDNFAKRLRLTREEVDALDFRLKTAGFKQGVEALRGPIGSIDAARTRALEGDTNAQEAFLRFGIPSKDLADQKLSASRILVGLINETQKRGGRVGPKLNSFLRQIGSEQLPDVLAGIGPNKLIRPPGGLSEDQLRTNDLLEEMLIVLKTSVFNTGARAIAETSNAVRKTFD